MIKQLSLLGLMAHEASGNRTTFKKRILDYIYENQGCTRQEVKRGMGIEINVVSGRVNDLLKDKSIIERGCKKDFITKKLGGQLFIN